MAGRRATLRPVGFDELGLRKALADRMVPFIVGAMAFLAALGLAGWVGAAALAHHWQSGAEAALTVQVPQPDQPAPDGTKRIERALAFLQGTNGVAEARILSQAELAHLLRPWLGDASEAPALPLPGIIAVRLSDPERSADALGAALSKAVPGSLVESQGIWVGRLARLARSVQACAGAALLALAGVGIAVIAVATRAGLAARREAIEIVHGLGASDGYIASRFASRATGLAAGGAFVGALLAAPVLYFLGQLAAPFLGTEAPDAIGGSTSMMPALWMLLPGLPLGAAIIGFATAQATVRRWLRQLP